MAFHIENRASLPDDHFRHTAIVVASIVLAIWPARAQGANRGSSGSEPVYALVTTSAKHVHDDLIKSTFQHVEAAEMDRLASHVCIAGKSDSGGLSIDFTSVLRASGIPARIASGRWARDSELGQNAADGPHVKAVFFATGVGWVPVDLGSAVILDKSSDGLEFFGTDNADFLVMHFDTDLECDTVFFGRKTVESVQGPVFWVTGSGSLFDFKLLVTSKIQSEPLDLSRPFPKPSARRPEPIPSKSRPRPPGQ